MATRTLCCSDNFFMSGIRFTKLDIVLDAIRKEKNILKDHADIREQ